jgi:hypothetical protein
MVQVPDRVLLAVRPYLGHDFWISTFDSQTRSMGASVTDVDIPFVAIIGGLWQLDAEKSAEAKDAGKALGAELANAGFGLVVYLSDEKAIEPHVVSGYVAALKDGQGGKLIRVRYAESQRGQIKFAEEAIRQELFDYSIFPGPDWEAPFYSSLAENEEVDGVVLVAGGTSTLIAGQIAIARRLPMLAIDGFGGAGNKIWNQLASASPTKRAHAWHTSSPADLVAQLKKECADAASKRRSALRREQILLSITGRRRQMTFAACAFLALLAILFLGMVSTPWPSGYPFVTFVGLISAGATGALVRVLLSGQSDSDPQPSLFLGSVAGLVVGLAYLIPQWVGAPGVLVKLDAVSATDKIQFASAVLVAISAGVGFDTVFSRLQKEAQDVAIGPSR